MLQAQWLLVASMFTNMSNRFQKQSKAKQAIPIKSFNHIATSCNILQPYLEFRGSTWLTHPARSRSLPFFRASNTGVVYPKWSIKTSKSQEWIVLNGAFFFLKNYRLMMKFFVFFKDVTASITPTAAAPLEVTRELKRNQSAGPISFVVRIPYWETALELVVVSLRILQ